MSTDKPKFDRKKDGRFISLGDDKFGGFKKGVSNGPEATAERKRDRSLGSCGRPKGKSA